MHLTVEQIGRKDSGIIKSIIDNNRFNPYSNIRLLNYPQKLNDYYYKLFFEAEKVKIFSASINGEIAGLLTVLIPEWDRNVFGMKMSRIEYLTAKGDYARELIIKKNLLVSTIKYLNGFGVKHISARIESNDFSSIHALESHGFKLMDNLLTYVLRERKLVSQSVGRWFVIKEIGREDIEAAGNLLAERCVLGHYTIDPSIPPQKVKKMYKQWLKNNCNDVKNNDIFIAKRAKEIVGCSFFSFNALLNECVGLKSLHRGLVASAPSAAGCFFAFLNAHMKKRKKLDFAEFETQTYNYNMMSIMQKLGMRLIRSRYTFHKNL